MFPRCLGKKSQLLIPVLFALLIFFFFWIGISGGLNDLVQAAIAQGQFSGLEILVYGNINLWIGLGFLIALILVGRYAFM